MQEFQYASVVHWILREYGFAVAYQLILSDSTRYLVITVQLNYLLSFL